MSEMRTLNCEGGSQEAAKCEKTEEATCIGGLGCMLWENLKIDIPKMPFSAV